MHKLALAEFKHRLKAAKGNNIKYISGYDSMEGSKVTLICKEHGKFKALPAHIVKSKECCPNSLITQVWQKTTLLDFMLNLKHSIKIDIQ